MALEVKICGLTDAGAVNAALDARADMLGFVFFPPSPRHLDLAQAAALAAPARGRARIVALTVDADDTYLEAIVSLFAPDMLQLHGKESPARVDTLAARHRVPVMKAVGVRETADIAAARAYAGAAARLLFDAKPPADATRPGGLGRAFDWRLLADLDLALPYMLSGGLDAASVAEAVRIARPAGVDVSSGVERAPRVKDPERIRRFVDAARAAAAVEERIAT